MTLSKYVRQFACFAVVGVSNTAIDIAVTNLLVILSRATSGFALFFISVISCGLATLNSYILNRRWTFRDAADRVDSGSAARFIGVATLSMLVNTSTFLFTVRYLPSRTGFSHLLTINVAKLAGVSAAFIVSFLGYRFGVFQTDAVYRFRREFRFAHSGGSSFRFQLAVLLAAAAAARSAYLMLTTAVYGEAVGHARAAVLLSSGETRNIDPVWNSLYGYWQGIFLVAGMGPIPSAIAASWIPGLLLIVPVVWVAHSLYGARIAWLAGVLCAVHPRLVEFSANGFAETFVVLAFATGVAFLTRVIQQASLPAAAGAGIAFGVFLGVRNEALVVLLLSLPLMFLARRSSGQTCQQDAAGTRPMRTGWAGAVRLAATALLGCTLTVAAGAGLTRIVSGSSGNYRGISYLARQPSGSADIRPAAREAAGVERSLSGGPERTRSLGEGAAMFLRRVFSNWFFVLERMPGVVLTPIPLFALFLPIFVARRTTVPGDEAPLALMLLFPLLYYPLTKVEPRLLFPLLIPLNIFGAAGAWAFSVYGTRPRESARPGNASGAELPGPGPTAPLPSLGFLPSRPTSFFAFLSGVLVLGSVSLCVWRGIDIERGYRFHRVLAGWINQHVSDIEPVVGSGNGYVSTTGFLAGRRTIPLPGSNHPGDLLPFVKSTGSHWLILYEPYLILTNPELLPVLDSGLQGFARAFEVRDYRGQRMQVFRRIDGP